mmetsp:Transcript_30714/g.99329  ORF Transcript_30714/g.99329 Transcript_30714/m.99329 type:complete len:263 (-) Transcript_30714:744-1532(-)
MTSSAKMEVLQDADLLHHMFSFLPAEPLANAIQTCHEWQQIAALDSLWFPLCRKLWEEKLHVPEQFLDAASTWIPGRGGRIRGLDAYVGSLRDSRRILLRSDELLDCRWHLRFKVDHRALHRHEDDQQPESILYSDAADLETATFRSDGTFVSSVAGAPSATRPLRWRLIASLTEPVDRRASSPSPHSGGAFSVHSAWQLNSPPEHGAHVTSVRIGAYPLLTVRRIPSNWAWAMHNRFVEIRSYVPRCEGAAADENGGTANE